MRTKKTIKLKFKIQHSIEKRRGVKGVILQFTKIQVSAANVSLTIKQFLFKRVWNMYISLFQSLCCCSVAKLCLTLQPHVLQHTRLPCPSLSPGVCSNSCPLSR